MSGTLYIVGTPIGNLGDITLRALETLKQVDKIAAEDTRHTLQLLNHFDIHKELISFHEHSGPGRVRELTDDLKQGTNIALVSDAGMPMVSDPGYALASACFDEDIPVAVIPGPSAATAVVALSGIDCRQFVFGGFLAAKRTARTRELVFLASSELPIVLYESPNRIVDLLEDICNTLGNDTRVCVAKEITKIYETAYRGSAGTVLEELRSTAPKGEFALVVNAHKQQRELEDDEIREQIASLTAQGMSNRDAARYAATVLGVPKKRAYKILVELENE